MMMNNYLSLRFLGDIQALLWAREIYALAWVIVRCVGVIDVMC